LKKVTLITTKQCSKCPLAKVFWRELKDEYKFDYEELDAASDMGKKHVDNFSIMSVPTAIVQNGNHEPILFTGTPSKQKAVDALTS
jgi:thioredoxin 1